MSRRSVLTVTAVVPALLAAVASPASLYFMLGAVGSPLFWFAAIILGGDWRRADSRIGLSITFSFLLIAPFAPSSGRENWFVFALFGLAVVIWIALTATPRAALYIFGLFLATLGILALCDPTFLAASMGKMKVPRWLAAGIAWGSLYWLVTFPRARVLVGCEFDGRPFSSWRGPSHPATVELKMQEAAAPRPPPAAPLASDPVSGCPKCGSRMVRRRGRYGAFRGCSTFPRCRGTRPAI